jgi:hypothetical protein
MDKKKNHYIDNVEFYKAIKEWKDLVVECQELGEKIPPVTDYIGECFLKIAEHLSYRPNFINYPYREEMISDGVENCLTYAHNFDPEKSKNPFSYYTQIIYYAFLRRIEREKKQSYIKYKIAEMNDRDGHLNSWVRKNYFDKDVDDINQIMREHFNLTETDVTKFEPKKKKTKKNKKK